MLGGNMRPDVAYVVGFLMTLATLAHCVVERQESARDKREACAVECRYERYYGFVIDGVCYCGREQV